MKLLDIKDAFKNLFSKSIAEGTVFDKKNNWMPSVMEAIQDEESVIVALKKKDLAAMIKQYDPANAVQLIGQSLLEEGLVIKRKSKDSTTYSWNELGLLTADVETLVSIYTTANALL